MRRLRTISDQLNYNSLDSDRSAYGGDQTHRPFVQGFSLRWKRANEIS